MAINIKRENTFKIHLKTGIDLFLGAGFSVLSKNSDDDFLPCGMELLDEIKSEFPKIKNFSDLSKASTVLEKSMEKDKYKKFLTHRFTVASYDALYEKIMRINISNIFTTNIDDLIFKIWEEGEDERFINNTLQRGESSDELAINYYPLHGCVRNREKEYIFSNVKIASAYSDQMGSWESLRTTVSNRPVLFWGWKFSDSDIIEAIYSNREKSVDENTNKWIVLYEPEEYEIEFYESLNFNIITASTQEMLGYFENLKLVQENKRNRIKDVPEKYKVPSTAKDASYPSKNFFEGDIPRWSYIYSGQIIKTHHFKEIEDLIYGNKTIVIIGVPASGKTTLMMQLASSIKMNIEKNLMYMPTLDEVKTYIKLVKNQEVLLFVDNCLNDYNAFLELQRHSNIQVVGFERDSLYEGIGYRLSQDKIEFELYDVSEIDDYDMQKIVESIPRNMRSGDMVEVFDKTIFETIRSHTNVPVMEERFAQTLKELYKSDPLATELFLMISYVHSCGTPVSYDMIYSYLDESDYKEVYRNIDRVGRLVIECYDQDFGFLGGLDLKDQDYYKCRTRYLAELIMKNVPNHELMRRILNKFVERIPVFKICKFDVFKNRAFDADIVTAHFMKYEDGIEFYEKCLKMDDSAFMYQQIALYASRKKKYTDAFRWIDVARTCARKNIFSIRNTHAIILFNANINKEDADKSVIQTLHDSMEILADCYKNDLRKGFHAKIFGEFVLKFYAQYGYEEVEKYVDISVEWLKNEINSKNNGINSIEKMKKIKKRIEKEIIFANRTK